MEKRGFSLDVGTARIKTSPTVKARGASKGCLAVRVGLVYLSLWSETQPR